MNVVCHIGPIGEESQVSKTHDSENFPVASLFLAKQVRKEVLEFYRFARVADDIADAPDMAPKDKLAQLDMPTTNRYQADLLQAFRQDAVKTRYESWDDLIAYCQLSANPVGQFLLHLHGEEKGRPESDALCSALQILNHLQDCVDDYKNLGRVYLPREFLAAETGFEELLSAQACLPALRSVLDECLKRTDHLLAEAVKLPGLIRNKRLRYQAKVTVLCGFALAGKLKKNDPVATRVELTKLDKILIAYKGLYPL